MSDRNREIREAIDAGNRALSALNDAERCVESARGFGIWDMLGGGMFSSMMKHSRMNDAQHYMERAQDELRNFSRELRDVQEYENINVRFDGFTQFIDVFCDNFLVDLMVQSKINDARRNLAETKRRVEDTLRSLNRMLE